jgi:hypothetical protein
VNTLFELATWRELLQNSLNTLGSSVGAFLP